MKILITVSVRWWNANAYYAISAAKALSASGHQVYVAGDPTYPPTIRAESEGLHTIKIRFASFNPVILIIDWVKLYRFTKREEIDIINAHRSEDHLLTAFIALKLGIPLVRTLGDVRNPKDNFINRWLHMKVTDFHILSSESIWVRYISTWPNFNPNKSVILGGVDGREYYHTERKKEKLITQLRIPHQSLVVGMVGRLSPIKGHVNFITAASLILEKIPEVLFIISGNEEEVFIKDLNLLVCSLNMGDHFRIFDRYEPVRDLMSIFTVGVIASKDSEVIARVAMEYIATGTPVVATDINVLPEVVQNNRNGLIVAADDAYEMAEAITRLLDDEALRIQISKNNLDDFKRKFDIFLVAQSITTIYDSLINSTELVASQKNAAGSDNKTD